MYELFWSPRSCAIAPHVVLEEIGVEYRLKKVPIQMDGRAETLVPDWFLDINPLGRVPVLSHDGQTLTETAAIMTYLARRHPEVPLLPDDLVEQARVLEWLSYLATAVHAVAFAQILRPQRFLSEPEAFPKVIRRGRENLRRAYSHIEDRLKGRRWAVGDRYSLSDIYLLFFYLGSKSAGQPMEDDYPAWSAVAARALQRAAVQRALSQEQELAA